ncbi:hypothetical protein F4782DRAFT_354329 [Xylaria castorea]|nr:hypothetical protein F4782DRAFT_354329 [Xylaria castorea]
MTSPMTEVDPDLLLTDLKAKDVAMPKGMVGGRRPNTYLPRNRQTGPDHVNGLTNPQQQKIANDDSGEHALDRSAQGRIVTHNRVYNASVPSTRAHSSVHTEEENTTGQRAKRSPSAATSSEHDIDEKPALKPPEQGSAVLKGRRFSVQNVVGGSGKGILPYVIQEEGAYRLPISLQLARTSSLLSELDLTMELAFLSPGQLQTLQRLLQYRKDEPLKLVGLEVAKKPNRRFWRKKRQITVAFVEGDVSDIPGILLPQADAPSQQMDGMAYLQSAQEVNHGTPPPRMGLPEFQDVTNDLSNTMHTPWSQASNGDRFTEYRVWHIEPYSSYDTGGDSGNDWARSLLKEETLPRVEIKRRLRILDKDPATMIEKSTILTNAQQFQVWRSIEAAKLGDPDPDYQWSLRQLEIIRTKRFFLVRQVKAIIVYVSKAPRLVHRDTSDIVPDISLSHIPYDFNDALHRDDIDTVNNAAAQRPTSGADGTSTLSAESGAFSAERPNNREYVGQHDSHVYGGPAAEMTSHRDEEIARANNSIASRPPIPPSTRRQTLTSADKYSKLDHELPRNHDREREDELVRKIRRLEVEIRHGRELQEESEWRDRYIRAMGINIGSKPRKEADRVEREPLTTKDIQYPVHEGRERKVGDSEYSTRLFKSRSRDRYAIDEGSPRNTASVRFLERSRSHNPHQLTYYDNPEAEKLQVRYPSQFDRRRFDPRSVAESQNAVQQLLLEWTPAHMREGDDEDITGSAAYDEGNSTSDTGSEEYVMAEESPTPEPSLALHQEQAKSSHSQSAIKVANHSRSWKVGGKGVHVVPPTANDASSHQDPLKQEKEKAAHDDVVFRGWGNLEDRTGRVSSSPQQLSRPSSQNANDVTGADKKSQWDVPQARTSKEPPTQETNDGARLFNEGKNISRASTLPQASRQPWSDEGWAQQIVEETARTAGDETGLDRLRGRRASFHFPMSRSPGRKVRTNRQRDGSNTPIEPLYPSIMEDHLGKEVDEKPPLQSRRTLSGNQGFLI